MFGSVLPQQANELIMSIFSYDIVGPILDFLLVVLLVYGIYSNSKKIDKIHELIKKQSTGKEE